MAVLLGAPAALPDGVPVVLVSVGLPTTTRAMRAALGVLAALSGQLLRRSTTPKSSYKLVTGLQRPAGLLVPYIPLANYQCSATSRT